MTRTLIVVATLLGMLIPAAPARADLTFDQMDGHISLGAWIEITGDLVDVELVGGFRGRYAEDTTDPYALLGPEGTWAMRLSVSCDVETHDCEVTRQELVELAEDAYSFDPLFGWARLDATFSDGAATVTWLGRDHPEVVRGVAPGLDAVSPAVSVTASAGLARAATAYAQGAGLPEDASLAGGMIDASTIGVTVDGADLVKSLIG